MRLDLGLLSYSKLNVFVYVYPRVSMYRKWSRVIASISPYFMLIARYIYLMTCFIQWHFVYMQSIHVIFVIYIRLEVYIWIDTGEYISCVILNRVENEPIAPSSTNHVVLRFLCVWNRTTHGLGNKWSCTWSTWQYIIYNIVTYLRRWIKRKNASITIFPEEIYIQLN